MASSDNTNMNTFPATSTRTRTPTSSSTSFEEDEIERIVRAAGIDSAPMDPSSMDALRQLVREQQQQQQQQQQHMCTSTDNNDRKPPPVVIPDTNVSSTACTINKGFMDRSPSDLTQPDSQPRNSIMEQLEFQTSLLLEMQRKMDALTAKVERLEGQGPATTSSTSTHASTHTHTSTSTSTSTASNTRYDREAAPLTARRDEGLRIRLGQRQPPGVAVLPPPPNPPAQEAGWAVFRPFRQYYNHHHWGASRVVQIMSLFWSQSRGVVRPLDGALLFKIMFMLLVVTARMSRSPAASSASPTRLTITILLMVGGFLWHVRYLQFVYQFVVTDNVPRRVWNGQYHGNADNNNANNNNAEPAAPAVPVPPNVAARQNPDEGGVGDWRNTFLGGGIQRRDPHNPIVAVLLDVLYLLGSFVFSIFPMWRPEAPPPPTPPVVVEEAQPQPHPAPPRNQGLAAIPPVRPPRDAMEAASDSDDDDDDDDEGED
jgi:hypothetical protein